MKKFLCALLALVMVLCSAAAVLADEPVTIKVLTGSNIQSFFEGDDENHNYMIDWIEEQTGLNVEWFILPTENGDEKRNAMMASATEVPDVVAIPSRNLFLTYANDGLIQDITEYITDDFFANDSQGAYKLGILDGKYYAVATPGNQSATTYLWWYNKAALAEAGIEISGHEMTLDEFTNVLYAVKEAYPDKIALGCAANGTQDWINGMQEVYGAFGIANAYRLTADGQIEYALSSEDGKAALEYMNKLYADGVLDPEFLVTTKDTLNTKLMNGDVLTAMFAWYDYTGTYKSNIGNGEWPEVDHAWDYVNIIDGGRATKGQTTGNLNQSYMGVSYACKHPEEAVKLIHLMLTPEYYDKCFFGTEGEDYYYDETGTRWRNQESQIGKGFSESGTQWYVYYYFAETGEQRINRLATGNPNYDMEYVMDAWYGCKEVDDPTATMPVIEAYQDSNTDIADVTAAYAIKFVMGEYGFDQWDKYQSELEAVGLSDVLEALNEWYVTTK